MSPTFDACGATHGNNNGALIGAVRMAASPCACRTLCLAEPLCSAWTYDVGGEFSAAQQGLLCALRRSGGSYVDCNYCITDTSPGISLAPSTAPSLAPTAATDTPSSAPSPAPPPAPPAASPKKADDADDDHTAIIYGSVFGAVGVIGLAYGILVYTGNLSPPRLFRSAGLGYNRAMSEYM